MPIFLLIRHGENDYVKKGLMAGRLPGVHLNKKGHEQATAAAEQLAGAPVKAIYSSPLERALETAQPISRVLSLPVITRSGLIEIDVGEWQNQSLKQLNRGKLWKIVSNAPSRMQFPGGETFAEAQIRICNEIVTLSREHEPKDLIICVSHADPIRLAVAYFVGLPLDLFQRLYIAPASFTVLDIREGGSRLLTLNYEISFTLPRV
jgi:probable phosphomutase (TIGR03848 family)